jgi:predicted helicase
VAHFKLTLQLAARDLPEPLRTQWAYLPEATDRLAVYLTNTLEQPHTLTTQPDLPQWCTVAEETSAANEVKSLLPIMVVMGNPPYAGHSANASWRQEGKKRVPTFIGKLLQDYYQVDGQPLGEKNPKWLQDDYVKFIRFGQWRIEQTGSGILAIITNNGYLDNPTFRGMRQQLLQAFSEIYILNLHGSTKKKEHAPDGGRDENVFDIQSGVAITLFVRKPGKSGPASVHYADLWGRREAKYERLLEDDVRTTAWETLAASAPAYALVPRDTLRWEEYRQYQSITAVTVLHSNGIVTARDHLVAGGNQIEPQQPRYDDEHQRVYINSAQYFEGVPADVWAFHIGGYQVCEKWLKDRRGRTLSYDDLTHYQKVVVALAETLRLMAEIDRAIPSWPIQ